ncbi:MAG TPA: GntR family transcriptional regulator [Oceanipulchritudo sp.]|nr:GntR family transcriptional regulator [Oceanipulchritudo sp.]
MIYPKPSLVELYEDMPIRTNLPDRIYGELKRRILSGLIAPGEHMLEKTLCEDLNVSRTPLREALNRLGNEDLVVYRPNCGFLAAPLSAEEARRLQDLRRIVESKVAALAAMRATDRDIKALRSAADMPEIIPGDDKSFVQFCRANARFHLLLVRTIDNHLLENIVMAGLDQYQRPAYLGIGRVTDSTKATKCHHDIVDALEARDPVKAEVVMCGHVIGGSERIIKALIEAGF